MIARAQELTRRSLGRPRGRARRRSRASRKIGNPWGRRERGRRGPNQSSISHPRASRVRRSLRPARPSRHLVQAFGSSAVLRSGITHIGETHYVWRPLADRFLLLQQDARIGSVEWFGLLSRRAAIDLPEVIPLPAQVFLFWLAAVDRRQSKGSGAD
jgi:hypothetical protein